MIQIDTSDVIFTDQETKNVNFSVPFMSSPSISAIATTGASDSCNVEIFVSNLTNTGCTLNSSARFTGTVRVVAVRG